VRASGIRCPRCGWLESEILQMARDGSYMAHRCIRCENTYITTSGRGPTPLGEQEGRKGS
jgi:phage FluMu protein Com